MKRYDYRNDYKNWDKERIENHLPYLKNKLLDSQRWSKNCGYMAIIASPLCHFDRLDRWPMDAYR